MNQSDRLERDLTAWFADVASPRTPHYTNDILAQAARTRQRPAWLFPERWLPMGTTTLARRALQPLPWRTIGLLALLALLLIAAVALAVGSRSTPLPAPYGLAANGLIAVEEAGDILGIDALDGTRSTIVGGPDRESSPVFSRDGARLAFVRDGGVGPEMWVADADGANPLRLSTDRLGGFGGIEWAPDGRSIMTTSDVPGTDSIWIVPADGGDARLLDVGMAAEGVHWRPPDGREILFRGTTPTGFGLFAVRPDGAGLRSITPADGTSEWDYLAPLWSPDGTAIVFQYTDEPVACGGGGYCGQRLFVIAADGSGKRRITSTESVGGFWSPGGTDIAFWDTSSSPSVHVVAADGTRSSVQTGPAGPGTLAGWAPDGSGLLYLADGTDTPLLLDPAGGDPLPLPFRTTSFPDWQRLAP